MTTSSDNPPVASLSKQTFFLMLARTVGFVFSFALPLVLARVFDRSGFGVYKQAFLIVMTCGTILPLNFNLSAFYFLPRETGRKPSVILNILLAYTVMSAAMFFLLAAFPGILTLLLGRTELIHYATLLGAVACLWTFSGLTESLATANQDVAYSTWFIISAQFTKTALLMSAAILFQSIGGLLWAAVAQGVLQAAILFWYVSKRFPRWWRALDVGLLREQTVYVLPFGIAAVMWKVQMDLHSYLVANRFSDADFAVYAVGVSQLPLVQLFRESINSVLLGRMSALQQNNRNDEMIRLFFTAMRKLALAYIPIVALLLVVGRELIILLYTKAYEASWPLFALNLLTLLFSIVSVDAVLRAHWTSRFFLLKVRVFLIVALVAATFPAMRSFGLMGATAALVLILAMERVILFLAVAKILDIRASQWKACWPLLQIALAALGAGSAAFLVRMVLLPYGVLVTLIGACAVFALVYGAAVLVSGILDETEWKLLRRVARMNLLDLVLSRLRQSRA